MTKKQTEAKLAKALALLNRCRPFVARALHGGRPHAQSLIDAQAVTVTFKREFPYEWENYPDPSPESMVAFEAEYAVVVEALLKKHRIEIG